MNRLYSPALESTCIDGMSPLLEYYQGKTKELIKCEEYFKQLIKQVKAYKVDRTTGRIGAVSPLTKDNPLNKKIEEEFRKLFNVREFNLHWTAGSINGYTMSPLLIPIHQANWRAGKPVDLKIHVWLYDELITMADLNERELVGIILHEVGHNFYYCPLMMLSKLLTIVLTAGTIFPISFLAKGVHILKSTIVDWCKKHIPGAFNIVNMVSDFMTDISIATQGVELAKMVALLLSGEATLRMVNPIDGIVNYGGESGADSMAARYGYGPDVASGLRKMMVLNDDTISGSLRNNTGELGSIYFGLTELTLEILCMMTLRPHPSNNQRASSMLKKLKRDLAKGDYPPGVKKDLEAEIKRMEKMYNTVNLDDSSSSIQIKQAWYKTIDAVTDGNSDFREILSPYFDSFSF